MMLMLLRRMIQMMFMTRLLLWWSNLNELIWLWCAVGDDFPIMVILAFIMLLMAEYECVTFMRMTMRLLLPPKKKARLHLLHTQLSFTSLHSSMAYCWMKSVCNCWSFLFNCTEPASWRSRSPAPELAFWGQVKRAKWSLSNRFPELPLSAVLIQNSLRLTGMQPWKTWGSGASVDAQWWKIVEIYHLFTLPVRRKSIKSLVQKQVSIHAVMNCFEVERGLSWVVRWGAWLTDMGSTAHTASLSNLLTKAIRYYYLLDSQACASQIAGHLTSEMTVQSGICVFLHGSWSTWSSRLQMGRQGRLFGSPFCS